jgi:CheY-like chemotaxis protein
MRNTAPEDPAIAPIATAVVLQGSHTIGPFAVGNLSPQALTLEGPSFGNLSLGEVTIVLSIPGRRDLLRVKGAVVHAEWQQGYCMGASVCLASLGADLEDQIQEIVARHIERSHMPMVVVLDGGRLATSGMRRVLHTLGRNAVFVQNRLDAIWLLERFRDSYSTILVDYAFVQANGPEILLFLHDQYLDKRRVIVMPQSEPARRGLGAVSWSAHGIPTSPWTLDQFKAALGIFPSQRSGRAKRILFVDDEQSVLSGLQHRLRKHLPNFETVWVTSGEVALSEHKARPFAVVVADLHMPGVDGVALLHAIRAESPQSKRIVLSGCDTYQAKEVANVVLHKPCPIDALRLEVFGPS